jgi:hypothetical protein
MSHNPNNNKIISIFVDFEPYFMLTAPLRLAQYVVVQNLALFAVAGPPHIHYRS